jgi:hypothetical protein
MRISIQIYIKFIESQSAVNSCKFDVSKLLESSREQHIKPLTEKQIRYILRHPKKMEMQFGYTNIQSL